VGENVITVISNIRIHIRIMQLLLLGIRIRTVIKCLYYPLSAYEVMTVLDYYPNLYASFNNTIIAICKLK
jgi:hypothetical protein